MRKNRIKTLLCLCAMFSFVLSGCDDDEGLETIPLENISDDDFKRYLLDNFDTDKDGMISVPEAEVVTELNNPYYAASLDGIQYFPNLKKMICYSSSVQFLDLSKNLKLEELDCSGNNLTSLVLPKTSTLTVVNCSNAFSASLQGLVLDFSGNPMLKTLDCSNIPDIKTLDLSKCTALNSLNCFDSNIAALDLSSCTELKMLRCNDLENVTLSENVKLDELNIWGSQSVSSLDLRGVSVVKLDCSISRILSIIASGNESIKEIKAYGCTALLTFVADGSGLESVIFDISGGWASAQLSLLDLKNCIKLNNLIVRVNDRFQQRSEATIDLDISGCTALKTLSVNYVNSLNATGCTSLKYVDCYGMITNATFDGCTALENVKFSHWAELTALDLSNSKALKTLLCYGKFTNLNLSENSLLDSLECWAPITDLNIDNLAKLRYLQLGTCSFPSLDITKNSSLEELVLDENDDMDVDASGLLSLKKIDQYRSTLKSLNVEGCKSLESIGLSDVESLNITGCSSLKTFVMANSSPVTSLDLSDFAYLDSVYLSSMQLQSLKVSKNIRVLECWNNLSLTSLNLDDCQLLETFIYHEGALSNLSLSKCASLKTLYCYANLTSLNVDDCVKLEKLSCSNKNLTSLNVDACVKLETLLCSNNNLTTINVDNCSQLKEFDCENNKLTGSLDVSKCMALTSLYCRNNPDLTKLIINKNHSINSIGKDSQTVLELKD